MQKEFIKSALLGAASLAVLALPATTRAQGAQLEEVVVTAQKREQSLQDTPISLVALGPAQLEQRGIGDVSDLQGNVPNLQITQHPNAGSTPRIFIRGVGNFDDQITQDPSVAVYMDGIYIARSQGMSSEVAEIERVEVLRGPQGTLYGRNATGGAINFITRSPELGRWGFSQTLGISDNNGFRSRTSLNAPLGSSAALRLAYLTVEKDGAIKNAGTGEDFFGSEDRDAMRADLRWAPSDAWDIRYAYDRSNIDDTPAYIVAAPASNPDPGRPSHSRPTVRDLQASDITSDGHSLTVSWALSDALTLKSLSAYRRLDSFNYQDYLGILTGFGNLDQEQWSQELQAIGSALDQRLEYVAGLYYFHETGDSNGTSATAAGSQVSIVDISNTALAAYVQATWTPALLGDRLHITPGLRWSEDQREADLNNRILLPSGLLVANQFGRGDRTFTDLSPALTIGYDLTDATNVYAKWVQGYKTGGYNIRASTMARFEAGFDPEELTSYELGLKSQLWDNRLRLNAAVFHADYDDIQINAQTVLDDPSKSDVINAGKATIDGFEFDLTAVLAPGLTTTLSYAYLDARYDEIIDGVGRDATDLFAFVNAPHHSYTLDVDYLSQPTPIGSVHANLNYSWQDDKVATVSTANGKYMIDDYGLLNARLALEEIPGIPTGSLRVALWGKNLEDKEYTILNAPLFGGQRLYGEPRSYGLEITYDY